MCVGISRNFCKLREDIGPSVIIRSMRMQLNRHSYSRPHDRVATSSGRVLHDRVARSRRGVQFPLVRARRGNVEVANQIDRKSMGISLGLGKVKIDPVFQTEKLSRCQSLVMDIKGN